MKPGDKVKIIVDGKDLEGVLMPTESDDSVFIKLESGYNVGVDKKKIKKIDVIEKHKDSKIVIKLVKSKAGLKKIVVLHTGGTIASKVDYESGAVTAKFTAADLIAMVPELADIANIETELVANMMSEDMNFSDYQKLSKSIKKHSGADGIIIGHGTDTLAYTSAALSFMFEKINIPVMIVGSQRSTDRGSSDGAMNLICAAEFISKADFCGVGVCMHNSTEDDKCAILSGVKARKMHTSRRDAFKAINDKPIALVDYVSRKIEFLKNDYSKKTDDGKVVLKDKFSDEVGIMKTYPNMKTGLWDFYFKNYKAVIIEGTGLGHAPTNLGEENFKKYELLKKYISKGGIVAMTSQCIFGRVHPDVYTNLRRLSSIGVIFCEDMTPETAYIKLSWLLGNYPIDEAKNMLVENLRGEINDRLEVDEYLD